MGVCGEKTGSNKGRGKKNDGNKKKIMIKKYRNLCFKNICSRDQKMKAKTETQTQAQHAYSISGQGQPVSSSFPDKLKVAIINILY